jgi:D-erythro-7,8-dihydroneopterin triphosphate epimerase
MAAQLLPETCDTQTMDHFENTQFDAARGHHPLSPAAHRIDAGAPGTGLTDALITVSNLRLRTYVGFNPEERAKQQDVVINLEVSYVPDAGVYRDDVEAALDYKHITKQIIAHVEGGRFLLLEKLVSDVLAICSESPTVNRARVCIAKPHALRFADSVSLTLNYNNDGSPGQEHVR